jgi:organic hydroperoxide reductase OsmC/OhrA
VHRPDASSRIEASLWKRGYSSPMNYLARVTWIGNRGSGTETYAGYGREYRIEIDGKAPLLGSADPAFRGEAEKPNPEDLFLAAVASCHMLFYLALSAKAGICVLESTDEARGTLLLDPKGGGCFERVALHPAVMISEGSDAVRAAELHEEAHARCFIARSCRVPITHHARIRRLGEVLP